MSKVCYIPNIHTTECQCGLFGHPKSCIWSLPITLPTAQWTFTFYKTAWWLYGNARLAHKNKTSVQPKKVTSLAPVKGGTQAFTTLNSNRLGMGEPCCGVVLEETAAGFRSKSPLCHLLELHCLWISAPKWHHTRKISERKPTLLLFAQRHLQLGECLWEGLISQVIWQISRQDVELFSLKISTMT